jgi:hypothetical protein
MSIESVQVAGTSIPKSTLKGIQVASAQSGVSFQYLLAKAAQESGFKTDAEAKTSSATGLFQFTRGTWLDVFKKHGAEMGYGDLSQKILSGPSGRLSVFDKATETKILSLREDAEASAKFAAAYARDNATALGQNLNRELDSADLYLAHFLGANGANQILSAAETAPNVYASHVVPEAARANRSVFFSEGGAPRTAREVVDLIRDRFGSQMDRYADVATAMAGEDDARAISANQDVAALTPNRTATAQPNLLDFGAALQSGDDERMTISWFVMQELARMISTQPMSMMGDEEPDSSTTSLTTAGFQGDDMSQILVDRMARENLPPSMSAAITSGQAALAYKQTAGR